MWLIRYLLPIVFLIISFSCKGSNDVLAEMKNRVITRSQFHHWLQSRNIEPSGIYKNREESEKYLKQMALEILSADSAIEEKFDESPFFRNISRTVYANLLSSYYKSVIMKNLSYKEQAVEIKIIKLYFPADSNNPLNKEMRKDKISLAAYIIQQEKSGIDFDDLRLKYSEDKNLKEGKKTMVLPSVIIDKEIYEKIKQLKDGECVSEPVMMKDSVAVIKLIRWHDIDNNNAVKIIDDKVVFKKFIEYLSEGEIEYIIADRGAGLNIHSSIKGAGFLNRNELLFSVNGEEFKSGDLDEILKLFIFLKTGNHGIADKKSLKKDIAQNILDEYILSALAEREGISGRRDFIDIWNNTRQSILAGAYKYAVLSCMIKNGSNHLSGIEKVKSVSSGIDISNAESMKTEWEKELLHANDFRINMELLN